MRVTFPEVGQTAEIHSVLGKQHVKVCHDILVFRFPHRVVCLRWVVSSRVQMLPNNSPKKYILKPRERISNCIRLHIRGVVKNQGVAHGSRRTLRTQERFWEPTPARLPHVPCVPFLSIICTNVHKRKNTMYAWWSATMDKSDLHHFLVGGLEYFLFIHILGMILPID